MSKEQNIARYAETYGSAEYHLLLEQDLIARIGVFDRHVQDQLLRQCNLQREWAIITPCNPRSVRAREELNLFYCNELRYEVEKGAGEWFKALNRDPHGLWPDEPGFLVIDADLPWLMDLGRRFHQNALVAVRKNEGPRLIWL